VRRFVRAYNERDWEALKEVYADDLQHVDRRTVSTWGDLRSRDDLIAALRRGTDLLPDNRVRVEVIATDGRALVACREVLTGTFEGSPTEVGMGVLAQVRDGRVVRLEHFDPDDEDALIARFDALLVETAPTPAERLMAEWVRRYHARAWDGLRELHCDDWVVVDRRRPALWEASGPDDAIRQFREAYEQGITSRTRVATIAVDGDLLVMRQAWWRGEQEARAEITIGGVPGDA
jgi:ketosteroid isomerase-like protein